MYAAIGYATIELAEVSNTTDGICNGAITVISDGTAGPFQIQLIEIIGENQSAPVEGVTGISGTYKFYALCPGSYSIRVTNAYGCKTVLTTQIFGCSEITLPTGGICPQVAHPASCGSGDGHLRFIGCAPQGGVGPYSYLWSNGTTTFDNTGLDAGTYTLTITDNHNCTASYEFVLEGQAEPELVEEVLPACEGEQNGFVSVFAHVPGQPASCTYSFEWSNGYITTNDCISEQLSVPAGTYSVTVTNATGDCIVSGEYVVEETPDQGPFMLNAVESFTTCPLQNTGGISLSISGGNPPYTVVWNNGATGANLSDLAAGNYTATIADYCDREIFQTISVSSFPEMTTNLDAVSGCPGTGLIEISTSGGVPPYTYQWSNGQTTEDASGLDNGDYTLTVTDGEGCTQTLQATVALGSVSIIDETAVCEGLHDGSVIVEIYKANDNAELTVLLNGIAEIPTSSSSNPVEVLVGGLSPDVQNNLLVTIEGCEFDFDFILESIDPTIEFDHLERDAICVFNEFCDGEEIGMIEQEAVHDYFSAAGQGALSRCILPILCDNEVVKEIKYKKRKVKGGRYLVIITQAHEQGLISDLDFEILTNDYFNIRGVDLCDNVKYCPASFEITSNSGPVLWINGSGSGSWGAVDDNGCVDVNCDSWVVSNYTVCPGDLNVLGLDNDAIPPELYDCKAVKANVRLLNLFYESGVLNGNDYNGFTGSELESFLIEHGNKPEAACATVTFCSSDFTYVTDNLNWVNCNQSLPDIYLPLTHTCQVDVIPVNGENYEFVVCNTSADGNFSINRPMVINPNSDPAEILFPLTSQPQLPETTVKFLVDTFSNERLEHFGLVKEDSVITPKGILADDKGFNYYDYNHQSITTIKKRISDQVKFFIDDWDDDHTFICYAKAGDPLFTLAYEDSNKQWEINLQSDQQLNLLHASVESGSIYLGGTFSGEIFYDTTPLSSGNQYGAFLLKVALDGTIISYHIVENIDLNQPLSFSENRNGTIIIGGYYEGSQLIINGLTTTFSKNDGLFILTSVMGNSPQVLNSIHEAGAIQLVDITLSDDQSNIVIALYGNGTLDLNDQVIYSQQNPHLSLLSLNSTGLLNWLQIADGSNIDITKFDMTFGTGWELFTGVTFVDSLSFSGSSFLGIGSEDIALLKWNASGNIMSSNIYGSGNNENISQMFYDSKILYFGGELSGGAIPRTIGNYEFVQAIGQNNKTYISFIYDNDDLDVREDNKKELNVEHASSLSLEVYPNPFRDQLKVKVNGTGALNIEVTNVIGQLVFKTTFKGNSSNTIDLHGYTSGLFFVKATDQNGKVISTHKVVREK
ncbi:MAG: T9SS type A sorting domain-containing protein [Bacteroidota bacterium]